MKNLRTSYLRRLRERGLVTVGILSLAAQGSCSREVCAGVDGSCLALRVDGNENEAAVYIEVLDAFGQRLGHRRTDSSPHNLIEVPIPHPEAAQCLRVYVGSGAMRKTAVVRLDGLQQSGRIDRTIKLNTPPRVATFTSSDTKLAGRGSGVAIGRVPGFKAPLLVVGSVPMTPSKPMVQFFDCSGGSECQAGPPALEVSAPAYPIVLASSTDRGSQLIVGPSPLEPLGGNPALFQPSGNGIGYKPGGQVLSLASPKQAVFVAVADLNNDQKADIVVNWDDETNMKSGTSIFWSASPPAMPVLDDATMADPLSALATADLDADGFPDLIRSLGVEARVHLNQKSTPGKFAAAATLLGKLSTLQPLGLTTGDLNGDGLLDVAVTINTLVSGDAGSALNVYLADEAGGVFKEAAPAVTAERPRVASAADFNGDFLDDVLTANFRDGATLVSPTLVYGDVSIPFRSEDLTLVSEAALIDVATGDLNGDCLPDVAFVAKQKNSVSVLLNRSISVQ